LRQAYKKCAGFQYSGIGFNIYTEFPFQRFFFDQLPFVFDHKSFHTQLCFKSQYSYTPNEVSHDINKGCFNLQYNSQFVSIFKSLKNENNKHLNRKYLNYNLFIERLEAKDQKIISLKLGNLQKEFQLISYKNQLDLHMRFLNLISQENVHRLNQLFKVCFHRKSGIRGIINKFQLAAAHLYKPKGWTDNDVDLATLVLRLGGPSLLYTFNEENILPSSSFTYKVRKVKDTKILNAQLMINL
jgi:hypothetical protein